MDFHILRLNTRPKTSVIGHVPEGQIIPKILHQTYRSRDLPAEFAANVKYMEGLNQGWHHVLYDDADIEHFLKSQYGTRVFEYYSRINPSYGAARTDYSDTL